VSAPGLGTAPPVELVAEDCGYGCNLSPDGKVSLSYNGKPAAISPARSITHLGWQQESALARTRSNTCSRLDSSSP
jgi:hypothetical protein